VNCPRSWALPGGRVLAGQAESPRTDQDYLAWELFGNRAVRQGEWKLRWEYEPFGKGTWELFNLTADPAERKDLAAEHPDKLQALVALWDSYVRTNNVVLPSRSVFETLKDKLPWRVPDDPGYPPLIYKRQFIAPKDMLADPKPERCRFQESMRKGADHMKNDGDQMKKAGWLYLVVATLIAIGAFCPPQTLAQVPARFYWKTLSDANAVPVIFQSLSGNTNPFDPAHTIAPGASLDATLGIVGYARTFLCSIGLLWLRSFFPWATYRAKSPWLEGPSTNRPAGSATLC